jgi:hypothetical protein
MANERRAKFLLCLGILDMGSKTVEQNLSIRSASFRTMVSTIEDAPCFCQKIGLLQGSGPVLAAAD